MTRISFASLDDSLDNRAVQMSTTNIEAAVGMAVRSASHSATEFSTAGASAVEADGDDILVMQVRGAEYKIRR